MAYFTVTCTVEGLGNFNIRVPDYSSYTQMNVAQIPYGYNNILSEIPDFEPNTTIFYNSEEPRLQPYILKMGWPSDLAIDISKWIGKKISFSNGWEGVVSNSIGVGSSIGFEYNGVSIPICHDVLNNLNYLEFGFYWHFPKSVYRPGVFKSGVNIGVDDEETAYVYWPHIASGLYVSEEQAEFYATVETTTDPFGPGGSSGTGGGGGDFDGSSVPIDFPPLPNISVVSTGFVTLYSPTLSQLNELAEYMWSDLFDIEGWKKLFADPMDAILGLSIVPVNVPMGGVGEVKVGNISTGISLNKAASQYVEVDCGTINVNEYWGAYLDYSPFTKCEIFLPYVGTRPLSIDDVMGKTVHVKYHVDILSGGLSCFVKCGESVLYSYIGQCSASIPINSANYTNMLNGVLNIAGSIGSMVATGGATAPSALGVTTNAAVNQMKPEIQKSGAMSGAGGMLGMQIPYLILTRPRQALPSKQNTFSGYPSLITVKLSELAGYTEIEKIHLENIPATEVELTELEKLLMEGVIF